MTWLVAAPAVAASRAHATVSLAGPRGPHVRETMDGQIPRAAVLQTAPVLQRLEISARKAFYPQHTDVVQNGPSALKLYSSLSGVRRCGLATVSLPQNA